MPDLLAAFDVRPRVVLHPIGGDVVIDPWAPDGSAQPGTATILGVSVPYEVVFTLGTFTPKIVLHPPFAPDVVIDPLAGGFHGSEGVATIAGIPVSYTIVFGKPAAVNSGLWSGGLSLPLLIGGALLLWLLVRR